MRINSIEISNFRALASLRLADLGAGVILAGPNGCGKSCVLDVIRMIKSAYGSYEQDEWQQWFNEFQIALDKGTAQLGPLFNDPNKPISLTASFCFTVDEREYLRNSAREFLITREWSGLSTRAKIGPFGQPKHFASSPVPDDVRKRLTLSVEKDMDTFIAAIDAPEQKASITIPPKGSIQVSRNDVLLQVFSTYEPQKLGIIDFHGPNRNYNREQFNTVNLAIETSEQRSRTSALYNWNNKFTNVKTEMASAYVRHLLSRAANPTLPRDDSLTSTLNELFETFFQGKRFLGPTPTPDGRLDFPVQLATGRTHDIDNLSSGEKEVLYGYLRLHNSAPRNSIIMVDEPELHLNPKLIKGLASFYLRHLGAEFGNQLWLVTHSDALIRDATRNAGYAVFHVHPNSGEAVKNQATSISKDEEVERIVLDLIGDAATFRPNAKTVIFESDDSTNFDKTMVCDLFAELEQQVNAISAGSKANVKNVLNILDSAKKAGKLKSEYYAINDSDNEPPSQDPHCLQWDVYHIENYLLSPQHILAVVVEFKGSLTSEAEVDRELLKCAEEMIPDLLADALRRSVNKAMVSCIDLGFEPGKLDKAGAMHEAILRSESKLKQRVAEQLALEQVKNLSESIRTDLKKAIENGDWRKQFPGRGILGRFAGRHLSEKLTYEGFRDAIIATMKRQSFQPTGMRSVIDKILGPAKNQKA